MRILARLFAAASVLGAAALILMAIHIVVDTVLRTVGNPVYGTVEIVAGYYMPVLAFLPLAWVINRERMIVIEVFGGLYSERMMRLNTLVDSLISGGLIALLAYATWQEAMGKMATRAFIISVDLKLPIWIAHFFPPVGLAMAALAYFAIVVRLGRGLVRDQTGKETPNEH